MKTHLIALIGILCIAHNSAMGAVSIKKASSVSTQKTSGISDAASLLPTVISLVEGVKQIKKSTKELTAECIPSSSEITFVNKLVKEWAKTGAATAEEAASAIKMRRCESPTGGYESSLRIMADTNEHDVLCFDWFGGSGDINQVWYQFPMAVSTYYCTDGSITGCGEDSRKYASNIYDVLNLVDFDQVDLTNDEMQLFGKLTDKIEKCSDAKLSARKKALWQDFLTTTIGNMGQKTNTGSIMEMVGQTANSGTSGILQSLGGMATQFLGGQ